MVLQGKRYAIKTYKGTFSTKSRFDDVDKSFLMMGADNQDYFRLGRLYRVAKSSHFPEGKIIKDEPAIKKYGIGRVRSRGLQGASS